MQLWAEPRGGRKGSLKQQHLAGQKEGERQVNSAALGRTRAMQGKSWKHSIGQDRKELKGNLGRAALGTARRSRKADLKGSLGLGGLGPASCQDCAWLLQLVPPDMVTGVGTDGGQQ